MKRYRDIWATVCMVVLSQLTCSCGLIDMDFGEGTQMAYEMTLDHDMAYVILGDSFVLKPIFTPDTVSNHAVYYQSTYDSIAKIVNDTIVAVGEGETRISAISVQDVKTATCDVVVLPKWEVNPYDYPYEMVVYADVKVRGAAPTDDMKIGAFYGTQLRGTGEWIEHKNIKLMQFRIYSSYSGNAESGERIRFYCYEKDSLMLKRFPENLYFDGETHGSLKEPFKLTIP